MTGQQEPLKAGHLPAKFGGHNHFSSEYIMVLVFHVILQNHLIKGLSNFMDGSHLR